MSFLGTFESVRDLSRQGSAGHCGSHCPGVVPWLARWTSTSGLPRQSRHGGPSSSGSRPAALAVGQEAEYSMDIQSRLIVLDML